MRREIIEFVENMTAETTLDEVAAICRTGEELDYIFGRSGGKNKNSAMKKLSLTLRDRAEEAFKNTPAGEITAILVQKKLSVGYSKACAIKDWLRKVKS